MLQRNSFIIPLVPLPPPVPPHLQCLTHKLCSRIYLGLAFWWGMWKTWLSACPIEMHWGQASRGWNSVSWRSLTLTRGLQKKIKRKYHPFRVLTKCPFKVSSYTTCVPKEQFYYSTRALNPTSREWGIAKVTGCLPLVASFRCILMGHVENLVVCMPHWNALRAGPIGAEIRCPGDLTLDKSTAKKLKMKIAPIKGLNKISL